MKSVKTKFGYLQVQLWKDKKDKWSTIHRLVAQAFIPNDDPEHKTQVNHKDEDKTNNFVDNLEWCTKGYNTNYGTRNDRVSKALRNGKTSKQIAQYKDDKLVRIWPSSAEVKRQLGYSSGNIRNCCRGERKTAYGFKWEYAENNREIA